MKFSLLLIVVSLLLPEETYSRGKDIRFGVAAIYGPPLLIRDPKNGKRSGIAIDIINYVSKNLKLNSEIIELPRRRIDESLLDGTIDLVCYSNPAWTNNPETYKWSDPLGLVTDVIIRHKDAPKIKTFQDLKGSTIGTVEGYRYGKAESLFESKFMIRSDFFSAEGMLERMQKGQIRYGIISKFLVDYYQIGMAATPAQSIVNTGVIDSEYQIKCRMLKTSRFTLKEINGAVAGFQIKKYSRK
jgi:polar amino acid transport system substrate-binding protein